MFALLSKIAGALNNGDSSLHAYIVIRVPYVWTDPTDATQIFLVIFSLSFISVLAKVV